MFLQYSRSASWAKWPSLPGSRESPDCKDLNQSNSISESGPICRISSGDLCDNELPISNWITRTLVQEWIASNRQALILDDAKMLMIYQGDIWELDKVVSLTARVPYSSIKLLNAIIKVDPSDSRWKLYIDGEEPLFVVSEFLSQGSYRKLTQQLFRCTEIYTAVSGTPPFEIED
jgi:hypothetical protein